MMMKTTTNNNKAHRALRGLFSLVLFGLASTAKAQSSGIVLLERDTLISILQEFRAENGINPAKARQLSLGKRDRDSKNRIKTRGFRVQIFSGPNRQDAYAAKTRFDSAHPGIDSYVSYDEPNYRVKVGDFRSRSDANSFMNMLRAQYGAAFVFTEDIWIYE